MSKEADPVSITPNSDGTVSAAVGQLEIAADGCGPSGRTRHRWRWPVGQGYGPSGARRRGPTGPEGVSADKVHTDG